MSPVTIAFMVATCPQCGLQTSVAAEHCPACGAALHPEGVTVKTPAGANDPTSAPDAEVPNIALPALEEAGRWRIVLWGLHVLHLSVVLGLAGLVLLATAMLLEGEGLTNARGLVVGALVGHVTVGILVLVGLGACCAIPLLRARRLVSSALIMGILNVILVTTVGLGSAPAFEWRMPALLHDPWLTHVAFLVLLLNGIVALLCWLLFLKETTTFFYGPRLRPNLNLSIAFACPWAIAVAMTPLVANAPVDQPSLTAGYCLGILLGAAALIARFHRPLLELRRTLGRMVSHPKLQ
jgi:hypothetical protein